MRATKTATSKATAKQATSKASKAKSSKASTKAPSKATTSKAKADKPKPVEQVAPDYLAPNQKAILQVLAKAKAPMVRKAIGAAVGKLPGHEPMRKGFSKAMGAGTKRDNGFGLQQARGQGLELRGLVASKRVGMSLEYTITPKGSKVLAHAGK